MTAWLFGKKRKSKKGSDDSMGCCPSSPKGTQPTGGIDDTVIQQEAPRRPRPAEAVRQEEPDAPPYLLPDHPDFHPSYNGRKGISFNELYERTQEQLDSGNFGSIYQCRHKHGSDHAEWKAGAVKVTKPNLLDLQGGPINTYDDVERQCQEIRTLVLLQKDIGSNASGGRNILRLQEFFYNRNTKELRVVTELLQMNLRDWIDQQRQFTERQGRAVASVVVDAIRFMHERNIVHRDIKEANVVFGTTGELRSLKIVDFGLAKDLLEGEKEKAFCGSMGYIAPEIYMRHPYSFKVDLFSFGVMMFKILSGKRPWPAGPQEVTSRRTVNLEYQIINEQWQNVSNYGRDFIRKLLDYEKDRMDAGQAGQHEWLHERTVSVLRMNNTARASNNQTPSDAVINPQGVSTQENREGTRFWVEDDILAALEGIIPEGAFRGAIVPNPTPQRGGRYLVEESMPYNGKLLPFYIIDARDYTERECRNVCRAIARRIQLFHSRNVVHRKLHMENVVVENEPGNNDFNVSLRGIQYSQMIRDDQPLTGRVGRQLRGWQAFIGPEIKSEFYHDKRVDLWSLGAIIYMCLCGTAPLKPELYFSFSQPSESAMDLVRSLLRRDPRHRLTIDEVLRHPWMTEPDEFLAEYPLSLAKAMFEQDYDRSGRRSVTLSGSSSRLSYTT